MYAREAIVVVKIEVCTLWSAADLTHRLVLRSLQAKDGFCILKWLK